MGLTLQSLELIETKLRRRSSSETGCLILLMEMVTVYQENHMQPATHYKDKFQRVEPSARWYTPLCILGISLLFVKVVRVESAHGQYVKIFFYVHGSVHHESMSIIIQQDATPYSFYIPCKLLYMFRVIPSPIIRSTCKL